MHWFDPGSREKELKEKNKHVIQTYTTVDYEKLPHRSTDLTQQAGRKNQSRRLIWPSKQAEKIKAEEHASYSSIHNGRLRKASKQVHWFDPASRQKNQSRWLIWPSKQAERIKAKEQASYSTIHNGRLRKASKQVHWFDPASRQKKSKQKNKQVIQPSTTVDYEKLTSRCTDLIQEAGRKN